MSAWSIHSAYARIVYAASEGYDPSTTIVPFNVQLEQIPGLKYKSGLWQIPYNALSVVEDLRGNFPGVEVAGAAWGSPPVEQIEWSRVEELLRKGGEVQPWILDGFLTGYQKEAISFGWANAGVHYWHPTGSGKTCTGLITALASDGPVVVVTRAASRLQYAREIERFMKVRAYVIRPDSQTGNKVRVKGESWNDFRARYKGQGLSTKTVSEMWQKHQDLHGVDKPKSLATYLKEVDHRPFVVVAWESLTDNLDALRELKPGAVIYDESHQGKNSKRYDVLALPELPQDLGEMQAQILKEEREAKAQGGFIKEDEDGSRKMLIPVLNTASAAALLARSAKKRICTTATPVKDRVRDLWAQLDLAEPNAWGSATAWKKRHCDMKPGTYGGMDDRGSSNLDELNERISKVAHILKYEETHRQLPAKRRQSMYITPEDQVAPSGGFAAEIREAQKRGPSAILEVQLAQAASRKRKAVLGIISDHVGSNQKVVVFTGRKRDCDELGAMVRGLDAVKAKGATVWSAHGEDTTAARQGIIDDYMAHPGPCVLVGTGHAFGESLNIHDTDAALFVMLPYTPGQLRQWEGRFSRLGQKRPVVIYYVIAEDTVDEHVASILIGKLPAVQDIAKDTELAEASGVLSGVDPNESEEDFAKAVLAGLDFD